MKRFCIITNQGKDPDLSVTRDILSYLRERGATADFVLCGSRREGDWHYVDPERIGEGTQCLIVLGGDGTLLQTARDVVGRHIPLVGVNLGHLGFMAEVDKAGIPQALDKLLEDKFELEERMMLEGRLFRGKDCLGADLALNDIVITREGRVRVIPFNNYVNGEFLNCYNADGIIISTATGSTGYSLSAGGPIVSPSAKLAIMTPLAPHTLNTRTIVFPPEDEICVEIGEGRHGIEETALVTFDGDTHMSMVSGDKILIRRARASTKIVKLNQTSFVEALRMKFSVTG